MTLGGVLAMMALSSEFENMAVRCACACGWVHGLRKVRVLLQ
jgi:hypothetical protein